MQVDRTLDLTDTEVQKCPWDAYRALRDEAPVHYLPEVDMYVVSRYEDICRIVRDSRRFSMRKPDRGFLFRTDAAVQYYEDHGLPRYTPLSSDPPYHTDFRSRVEPFFTSSRIRQWEPYLKTLIEDLAHGLDTEEPVDFVRTFCFPLPMSVMTVLLGLPLEDHALLKHYTDVWVLPYSHAMTPEQEMYVAEEGVKLQRYILEHLEAKRQNPGEDLLSLLVQTRREDGSPLTTQEMVGFAEQAVVGANETTQNGLAMAMCAMIEEPGLEARLRQEPKRIKTFVEECLRLHSPTAGMYRFATENVTLHGVTIPKGAAVHLRFAAANRDERQFEHPDRLDVERRNAGSHVAFSHATHHCLGAPLARLELNLSFQVLLGRRRNFRLARGADSYDYVPGLALRQMAYLWLQSDPVASA